MEFRVFSPSRSAFQDAATGLSLACGAMASLLFTFVFFKLARKGHSRALDTKVKLSQAANCGLGIHLKRVSLYPIISHRIPERCMPKMDDSPRKCLWKSNGREKRIGGLQNVAGSYTRAFGWKYMKIFRNETQKRGVFCWMIFRFATSKNPFRKFFSARWWFQRFLCSARKLGKMNPFWRFRCFKLPKGRRIVGFWKIPWIWGTKHGEESSDNSAETEVAERSRSLWKMPTDTLKEDLAKVDPEKELNHLPTLSFKGMC